MPAAYASDPTRFAEAFQRFGCPEGLLRIAAKAIEPTENGHAGAGQGPAADDEARALRHFAEVEGLMLNEEAVAALFELNQLRGGSEHRVALISESQRVIKGLDVRRTATESLFDYLTDLLFSNCLFGDTIQLEGFCVKDGGLHIITSQPFIDGIHPDWETLKTGLAARRLRHETPESKIPTFIAPDHGAGEIHVFDLHENNVILGSVSGRVEPIDAHFYFDSAGHRIAALRSLGAWDV